MYPSAFRQLAVGVLGKLRIELIDGADDERPVRQDALVEVGGDRHLELLQRFRVPPTAVRTTPKPPADVLATAPELKGLIKVAARLHPRFSDEPKPDESKLGGRFLWPADEPWPTCDEHGIPEARSPDLR